MLDKTFPTNDCAMCTLAPKLVAVGRHPNIVLHTNARVTALEGEAGEFTSRIVERPRFIDVDKCTGCGFCGQYCPVEAISNYDVAMGERTAVSVLFPQTVPLLYSIIVEQNQIHYYAYRDMQQKLYHTSPSQVY